MHASTFHFFGSLDPHFHVHQRLQGLVIRNLPALACITAIQLNVISTSFLGSLTRSLDPHFHVSALSLHSRILLSTLIRIRYFTALWFVHVF